MRRADAIGLGLAAVVFILSVSVFFYAVGQAEDASGKQGSEPISYSYVIREYQGNIAVYESDADRPCEVYEVPVETLPEQDIQSLKEGILVRSEEELRRLLEDLTS